MPLKEGGVKEGALRPLRRGQVASDFQLTFDGAQFTDAIPDSAIAQYDATGDSQNAGDISSIPDQLGNFDMSGSASIIDSGINDDRSYRFDGTERMLQDDKMVDSTDDAVINLVVEQQEPVHSNNLYMDGGQDLEAWVQDDDNSEQYEIRQGDGDAIRGGTPITDPKILTVYLRSNGDVSLDVDGSEVLSGSSNSADLSGLTIADRRDGGFELECDYSEIVVYVNPTEQDIEDELSRLQTKFGFN